MLNVKAADDAKSALLALWPRLQSMAAEPVKDETDLVQRQASNRLRMKRSFSSASLI
jgi:hypothetical protein